MPRSTRRPGAKLLPCLALAALVATTFAAPAAAQQLTHFDSSLRLFADHDASGDLSCGDQLHARTIISAGIGTPNLTNLTVTWPVPDGATLVPGQTTVGVGPESTCSLQSGDSAGDRHVVVFCPFLCRTGGSDPGTCTQVGLDLQAMVLIDDPNPHTALQSWAVATADQIDPAQTEVTVLPFEPCPATAPAALVGRLVDQPALDHDADGAVDPGESIHYTLTVTNSGGRRAEQVLVEMPPPEHTRLHFGGVTTTHGTVTRGNDFGDATLEATIPALDPGETATIELAVAVDLSAATVIELGAQGTFSADNASPGVTDDPDRPGPLDATTTPVDGDPNLGLAIQPVPPAAGAGERITWEVTVVNTGRARASGIELATQVPPYTTFDPAVSHASWTCGGTAPGASCSAPLVTLPAGGQATLPLVVRIVPSLPPDARATTLAASVGDDGFAGPDPDPSDNQAQASAELLGEPELRLTKSGPDTARPGEVVTYALTAENTGSRDTAGVEVLESVPAHATFAAAASSPGWSCPDGAAPGTTCILDLGTLPALTSQSAAFAVRLDATLPRGAESLTNTALLRDGAGTPPAEASATTALAAAPVLTLAKTGPATAAPGDLVRFDLAYANTGDQDAAGVTLTETVPAPARFAAAASSPGWSCADAAPAGTACTLTLGALAAGEAGTAAFAVHLPPTLAAGTETLTNTATLGDGDGTPPATGEATVALDAAPRLVLAKTGPASAVPGQTIAFALAAENAGDQDTAAATLHETVPAHTTFDAATSTPGWTCPDASPPGTACTLDLGPLAAGESASATFAVRLGASVPAGLAVVRNTATLTGGPADPPGGDDVEVPVDATAELELVKTGPSTARPGDLLAFTLAYENAGGRDSAPARLAETVPDHTTFTAADSTPGWSCPDGSPGGTACTLDLGPIPAGASGNATFAVRLAAAVPAGLAAVRNVAVLTGGPSDPPGDDDVEIPVDAAPDLRLVKTGPSAARPGDLLVFTLAYQNAGDRDTAATALGETVPEHTTFAAADSTPGWSCPDGAAAGTVCTLDLGPIPAGASGTAAFAVRLAATVPAGLAAVRNVAVLTGGPGDPPGDDDVEIPVDAAADLMLDKRGPATARPGDTLVYALDHANRGDTTAAGALLTETVPAHTTFAAAESSAGWSCAPGAPAGTTCTLSLGDLAAGAAGSNTFAVRVSDDAPAPGDIVNTATLSDAAGHPPATDRVTTTLVAPPPEPPSGEARLTALLIDTFLEDADADGRLGAGDVVGYTAVVDNAGTGPAQAVRFTLAPDPHTELLPGTVTTTAGTIESGTAPGDTHLAVALGGLAPGAEATVTFETRLVDPLPPNLTEIAAQGDATAANAPATVTDDPDTAEPLDPTRTPLGDDAGPPEIVDVPTLQGIGLAALALLLAAVAFRRLNPTRSTAR